MALWLDYAQRKRQAAAEQTSGDMFGMTLSMARGSSALAAELLAASATPADAATEIHCRATTLWQSDLPLIGFDVAAAAGRRIANGKQLLVLEIRLGTNAMANS